MFPVAALIRGNRNSCTQFSNNLDWLISKLERLESSSGTIGPRPVCPLTCYTTSLELHYLVARVRLELHYLVARVCL